MMEHPSRRHFLGMSSLVMATAALSGLTADAQERASTQKAEHDRSSNDPGPENKDLLTANPNSNTPPPQSFTARNRFIVERQAIQDMAFEPE